MPEPVEKMSFVHARRQQKRPRGPVVLGTSAAGVQILKPKGKPSFSLAKLKKAIEEANAAHAALSG